MERMHDIQVKLDAADGWSLQEQGRTTLDRLNLTARCADGHAVRRHAKARGAGRALVSAPDVLLLDEPTNHLDFTSIMWLEGLLRDFKGSVLFITHDRSFLDNVATRIIELDRGRCCPSPGNFTTYQARKAELLENEEVENAKFDKFLAQEEVWIRKGVKARRTCATKAACGAWSAAPAARRAPRPAGPGQAGSGVRRAFRQDRGRAGKRQQVLRRQGHRRNFSGTILRGDKVGLIGANGAGKTTLLKMILGEETSRQRHRQAGHQAAGGVFRPDAHPAQRRGQPGTPSRRAATGSKSTASAST
jgi:ATP-binding cassette subfamily F protein uup